MGLRANTKRLVSGKMIAVIEVTAAVIKRGQEILITQRGEDQHLAGYWEFPGGKQEEDETLEDCLQREILEELDINISVGSHIMTVSHQFDEQSINLQQRQEIIIPPRT